MISPESSFPRFRRNESTSGGLFRGPRFAGVLLGIIFFSLNGLAGSEHLIFVPGSYAPLSSFQQKTTSATETLVLNVNPEVLSFLIQNSFPGFVIRRDARGALTGVAPTQVDSKAGKVFIQTDLQGTFVFVAEPFKSDFPIVTHWAQFLNQGRGGFQLGASDPIGRMDFDVNSREVISSTDFYSENPNDPYTFDTGRFALFSNDRLEPNAKVPGLDRYVGENYSVYKVTDLLATLLSLRALETTGYPLIHRNFPWAFLGDQTSRKISDSLPCFQIAHGVVTSPVPDQGSLSTYILPPYWQKSSPTPYPVLFNGFYDINENFFSANGLDFIAVISRLKQEGFGNAIGVLWNGGGAFGSYGVSFSSYWIAAHAFNLAQFFVNADLGKVVTSGISRGGITALSVAANPFFDNYRVQFALAFSPALQFGDHVTNYITSAYPGNFGPQAWTTGYKYSYRAGFIDPLTGLSAPQLILKNLFNSVESAFGDYVSPTGDWIIENLKSKGVRVLLSSGTHDGFMPFGHQLDFVDKLSRNQISFEHHIGHRFGHSYFSGPRDQMLRALKLTLGAGERWGGTRHFRRMNEVEADISKSIEFIPSNIIFAELPKLVWRQQKLRVSIVGQKDLKYALVYYKLNDDALTSGRLEVAGPPNWLAFGDFAGPQALQGRYLDLDVPQDMAIGSYLYLLGYSLDGVNWQLVDLEKVPQTGGHKIPIFEVRGTEPTIPAFGLVDQLLKSDRGWGMSSN